MSNTPNFSNGISLPCKSITLRVFCCCCIIIKFQHYLKMNQHEFILIFGANFDLKCNFRVRIVCRLQSFEQCSQFHLTFNFLRQSQDCYVSWKNHCEVMETNLQTSLSRASLDCLLCNKFFVAQNRFGSSNENQEY